MKSEATVLDQSVWECEILILGWFLNLQRRCTRCAHEMSYIQVDFSSQAPAMTRDDTIIIGVILTPEGVATFLCCSLFRRL